MRRLAVVAQELILPLVVFVAWWVVSANSESLYFPPVSTILGAFSDTWVFEQVGEVLWPTLKTFVFGYAGALVLGVALGLLLAANRRVATFVNPLVEFLRALPGVALVPVFMAVLGVGMGMRVTVVVFASIWPILLNTMDGVRGLDLVAKETAWSFRVPRRQRLIRLTLPGAAPQIVAGARVGLSLSLVAVIVTEMVAPAEGVGAFARTAQFSFDITQMWTLILLMGLVGYLLNLAFLLLERRILRWKLLMRATAGR
jgi:ABC-type nitrate/sulfonate/bicarbonate transport system permease component